MTDQPIAVIGGVDTHTDFHQAAAIDTIGRHLATESFPTTPTGYRDLYAWLGSHGDLIAVGVEGTGSYGAELARTLRAEDSTVIDVDRPDRRARRAHGESDPIDAYAAATAVLSGRAAGTPKTRDGVVEAIRALRVVRASAVKTRTQTLNQIRGLIVTVPAAVREPLRNLTTAKHLCAAAPISASSGRTDRHRLNRGGDRQANRALTTIVIIRMRHDPCTRTRLRRPTHRPRTVQQGHHAMPQTLRRPRDLPAPQATTRDEPNTPNGLTLYRSFSVKLGRWGR